MQAAAAEDAKPSEEPPEDKDKPGRFARLGQAILNRKNPLVLAAAAVVLTGVALQTLGGRPTGISTPSQVDPASGRGGASGRGATATPAPSSDGSLSSCRTRAASAAEAPASVRAINMVRLPSRRSSPAGFPVSAGSPKTPSRSSRSWKAIPTRCPYPTQSSSIHGSSEPPPSTRPSLSGCSTEYLPLLYSATRSADSNEFSPCGLVDRRVVRAAGAAPAPEAEGGSQPLATGEEVPGGAEQRLQLLGSDNGPLAADEVPEGMLHLGAEGGVSAHDLRLMGVDARFDLLARPLGIRPLRETAFPPHDHSVTDLYP